ncbi:hypothetical protein BJ742DRAFT_854688 [Cladochytrium replicatum]|nr:hypothetical protein BJ742DRAFT_854688 [Cladochytrium replicatum]
MAHIISAWLNSEVRLSQTVDPEEIDSAFSCGYLLGELLHKLDLHNDLHAFSKLRSVDAAIRNYTLAERILRDKLGIRLSSTLTYGLIKAQNGCASKLLYEIKCALAKTRHNGVNSSTIAKQSHGFAEPKTFDELEELLSYPNSDNGELFLGKATLPGYMERNSNQFFGNVLRNKLRRTDIPPKSIKKPIATKQIITKETNSKKQIMDLTLPALPKAPQASTAASARESSPPHALKELQSRPKRLNGINTGKATQRNERRRIVVDTITMDIDMFEKKHLHFEEDLHRLIDDDNDHDEGLHAEAETSISEIKRYFATRADLDPQSHLTILSKLAPKPDPSHNDVYLEKIRIKRLEAEAALKEREQRRKKIILTQKVDIEEQEDAQVQNALYARISRQSKQERRMAEQLMLIRREKEIMKQNRAYIDDQYAKRRQQDFEESVERAYMLYETARKEYREQTTMQLAKHREILEERKRIRHERNCLFVKDLFNQILNLSQKIAQYRILNDQAEIPKKLLNEWKTLFIIGAPLEVPSDLPLEHDRIGRVLDHEEKSDPVQPSSSSAEDEKNAEGNVPLLPSEQLKNIQLLDNHELTDYLEGGGDWTFGDPSDPLKSNALLGSLINSILEATANPEPAFEVPQLPLVPIQIALIGKRFGGKKTLAKHLATIYSLDIINVDTLVAEAVSVAKTSEKAPKKSLSDKATFGSKLQAAMMEGSVPDDTLLVTLVVEAIRASTASEAHPGGWVLVDFPRNRNQAQLMERELSGYEDPKPIKLGNIKRLPKEKEKTVPPRRSLIAPSDNKSESKNTPAPQSAIDAIIWVDIENESAIRRANGFRVDPVTGQHYHLELDPPPKDNPAIIERLVHLDDDKNDQSQLQYQLAAFEEQEDLLKDWFGRFNNLNIVDGNEAIDSVVSCAQSIIQPMIVQKAQVKESKERFEKTSEAEKLKEVDPLKEEDEPKDLAPASKEEKQISVAHAEPVPEKKVTVKSAGEEDRKAKPGSARGRVQSSNFKDAGGKVQDAKSGAGGVGSRISSAAAGNASGSAGAGTHGDRMATAASSIKTQTGGEKSAELTGIVTQAGESADGGPTTNAPVHRAVGAEGQRLPSKELAEILTDQWALIENTYVETLKFSFRSLRREGESVIRYFHETKLNFKTFLERPDKKQALVRQFQLDYNSIEDDLRSDPDAKAELHQRAEDLRDRLWDLSDERRDDAEVERLGIIEDRWVEDHYAMLVNVYIALMQAEVDKFCHTRQWLTDYYRDTLGVPLAPDTPVARPPRIPTISAHSNPPLDVSAMLMSSSLDSLHKASASHRRELATGSAGPSSLTNDPKQLATVPSARPNARGSQQPVPAATAAAALPVPHTQGVPSAVKKQLPPARGASVAADPKGGAQPAQDKDHAFVDVDAAMFGVLSSAAEVALSCLSAHDEGGAGTGQEKEKKEKKKGVSQAEMPENKETEVELPSEYTKTLEVEDALFRKRVERLRVHGQERLRELRSKAVEVYMQLDEWIGLKFSAEMDGIRSLMAVVKEAIESEARLPNELGLEAERFRIEFNVLTYEPDPERRPESPVEKQVPDQFTVLQLVNLALSFMEIAPSGNISIKDFIDSFQHFISLGAGLDLLPELYMNPDTAHIQQTCMMMDPYETGFVNWRRFILMQARILPAPSAEYIAQLKAEYMSMSTYRDGKVSKEEFLETPLWFEEEQEETMMEKSSVPGGAGSQAQQQQQPIDALTTPQFNRSSKLKQALALVFAALDDSPRTTRSPNAGSTMDTEIGGVATRSSIVSRENGTPPANEAAPPDGGDANRNGLGVRLIGEHEPYPEILSGEPRTATVQVEKLLLGCSADESSKAGIQKAFAAISKEGDGSVTLKELYEIFHWSFVAVEETHRLEADQNVDDPFSIDTLRRIFFDDHEGGADGARVTYEHVVSVSETQGWAGLQHGMLLDMTGSSSSGANGAGNSSAMKSRPSSSARPISLVL